MARAAGQDRERTFTPALGKAWLTPFYDTAIGLFTRERKWRDAIVDAAALVPGDRVIDVGSGTGSLIHAMMANCPQAELTGVEPDLAALKIARRKMGSGAPLIHWHNGFLGSLELPNGRRPSKIVSSLVLHQVPIPEKRAILEQMYALLAPGGLVLIADYMQQETRLMRALFRATVQQLDGIEDTQPNADGIIEAHLCDIFDIAEKLRVFATPTGAISLWHATKKGVGE